MTQADLIDRTVFAKARAELGPGFGRILGYFREDGVKSVAAIEAAMRELNAPALVIPAHTLKGEARQFGAEPLALLAERIENIARDCVETRDTPDDALTDAAALRGVFEATMTELERSAVPATPAVTRPLAAGGFGRKVA